MLSVYDVEFHRTERATKFSYSPATGKWEMEATKVRIAKEWFSEGGMRRSYCAVEAGTDVVVPYVIKLFKDPKTKAASVFQEALTQAVCERYAMGFNNLCERKGLVLNVKFLPVWVLHLPERGILVDNMYYDTYVTMEPFLPGKYVKLSDNNGKHLNDMPAQAAQTFSHYSFLASGRRLVCVDIQGVSELFTQGESTQQKLLVKSLTLTDPQIHSLDGDMFGAGNLGVEGINLFVQSYRRTKFDERLGLAHLGPEMKLQPAKPPPAPLPTVSEAAFDTEQLAEHLSEKEYAESMQEQEPSLRQQSVRERQSSRMSDFSMGGEVHRLSMRAKYLAQSLTQVGM